MRISEYFLQIFLLTLIIVGIPSGSWSAEVAQSCDVYNFYFQKAPGPQTVHQGQSPDAHDAVPEESEESVEGTERTEIAESETEPRKEYGLMDRLSRGMDMTPFFTALVHGCDSTKRKPGFCAD